jgi:beta-phosphoglucomutase-like phosphatase (HAD superfamily)
MAICSGATLSDIDSVFSSTQKRIGVDLKKHFEAIITADDVSTGKPDPEGYLLTLEKLREVCGEELEACDCVVIEDSHWGIEAGQAAGMKVIAVANSYSSAELEPAADMVVETLKALTVKEIQEKFA